MLEKIIVGIIVLAALLYGLRRIRASLKGGGAGCGCGGCGAGCSGNKTIKPLQNIDRFSPLQASCCGDRKSSSSLV